MNSNDGVTLILYIFALQGPIS